MFYIFGLFQTEQIVFLCILFAMIVIGNTLVLAAIVSSGKRRSRMNFFIINLACAGIKPLYISGCHVFL